MRPLALATPGPTEPAESDEVSPSISAVRASVLLVVCNGTTKGEEELEHKNLSEERERGIKMCLPNKGKAIVAVVVMVGALILAIVCIDLIIERDIYYGWIPLAACLTVMGAMCLCLCRMEEEDLRPITMIPV